MSRERPPEPPRVVPDVASSKPLSRRQYQAINELEKLKRMQGPGFFGAISRVLGPAKPRPLFVRASYESNIVDNLRAFYSARPRPWRPANRSSCNPTFKERVKAQRRARA